MSRQAQILLTPELLRAMIVLAEFDGYEIESAKRKYLLRKHDYPKEAADFYLP